MADDVLRMKATVLNEEALANIRKIANEIGLIGRRGAPGIKQVNTEFTTLSNTIRRLGSEVRSAIPALGGMGLGAAGVGLAFGGLLRTFSDLSKRVIELKYASKEIGMSERDLRAWGNAAEKVGVSSQSMQQGLMNFSNVMNGLKYNIGGVRSELVGMGAGAVVAAMEKARTQGDKLKIAFRFKDELMKDDPSGFKARAFFDQIGLGADKARLSYEAWQRQQAKTKAITPEEQKAIEDYHAKLVDLGEQWSTLQRKAATALMPGLSREIDTLTKLIDKMGELDKYIEGWTGKGGEDSDLMGRLVGKLREKLFGGGMGGWGTVPEAGDLPAPQNQSLRGMKALGGGFKRIAYGGGSESSDASNVIKVGVYDALVEFASYSEARAGGAGGFQNASLGGAGGGFGGGGGGGAPAGSSAPGGGGAPNGSSLARPEGGAGGDLNKEKYEAMFKGTPLAGKADAVIAAAKANNVPPSVMAGILAHETGQGKSKMLRDRNNPAGLMDPKTGMKTGQSFGTVEEGIAAAGRTIGKHYARSGGDLSQMGKSYAPPGAANDPGGLNPGWASGVQAMQGRLAADGGGKAGGTVGLSDERGRAIDATTMKQIEALGRAGNVQGVQSLLNSKGYRASGPWCGVFASRYVSSAGFKPPPGAAVASNWNTWGQGAKPSDINAPGRPFGSMVGSYNVRRYGGGMGRPLGKGQTGGHVVTFMPGSYDPKTGTALSVDQHGYGRRRRVTGGDIDIRYAGDEAVAASRGIDGAISTRRTPSSVAVTVNSNGTKADASAKKSGPDFQEPAVVQKRQLQPTDAQELGY